MTADGGISSSLLMLPSASAPAAPRQGVGFPFPSAALTQAGQPPCQALTWKLSSACLVSILAMTLVLCMPTDCRNLGVGKCGKSVGKRFKHMQYAPCVLHFTALPSLMLTLLSDVFQQSPIPHSFILHPPYSSRTCAPPSRPPRSSIKPLDVTRPIDVPEVMQPRAPPPTRRPTLTCAPP